MAQTPTSKPSSPPINVELSFSRDAYDIVERMAKSRGTNVQGVIKEALKMESFYDKKKREGGSILVKDRDGKLYKVARD